MSEPIFTAGPSAAAAQALLDHAGKSALRSKKLWATVLGVAGIVIPAVMTGGLSWPVVAGIAIPVASYVLGQAGVDAATATALSRLAAP